MYSVYKLFLCFLFIVLSVLTYFTDTRRDGKRERKRVFVCVHMNVYAPFRKEILQSSLQGFMLYEY